VVASSDYQLGRQIGQLLRQSDGNGVADARLLNHLPDYLGQDLLLLAPLRDLLMRPGLRNLLLQDQQALVLSGRDSLIADLQLTYSGVITDRLQRALNGILNLPDTAATGVPFSSTAATSATTYTAAGPPPPPANATVACTILPAATGQSGLNSAAVALLALVCGGALVALIWVLINQSQQTRQAPSPASQPPQTSSPATTPPPRRVETPSTPSSPWGAAEQYKFGQGPSQTYPNTCAFSQTDASGEQTLTDKSQLEFWACRDEGGNPDSGYAVTWGDGKRTTYQFMDGGSGRVVGTNGHGVAMQWRNDTHNGRPIIVITHQDGATSWIPGHVGD
jgi:hypothetical protein